jgi:predicted nucleic acid-binding protein
MKYLWDTNTCIYFLNNLFPPAGEILIDEILKEFQPCISAITEIELLCWNTEKETEQKLLEEFVKDCYIFDLDLTIKKETVKIRKASKVKLPDAIIAATSIVNNLTLLTRNVRDFQKIDSLEIINPWEV